MKKEAETALRRMPKYKFHNKEVHAIKLAEAGTIGEIVRLRPEDKSFGVIELPIEWANQYCPQAGGYYVIDEDLCESYIPAKAFELEHNAKAPKPTEEAPKRRVSGRKSRE